MHRSLAGSLLALMLLALTGSAQSEKPYPVTIHQRQAARQAPDLLAQKILERLGNRVVEGARVVDENHSVQVEPPLPEVLSMDLVDGDKIASIITGDRPVPVFPGKRVWVIQARGLFEKVVADRGQVMRQVSGYYYVDDETGEILGHGAPAPRLRDGPEGTTPSE
jgi:hypothetical protein